VGGLGCGIGEEVEVSLDMVATGEGCQQSTWHLMNPDSDYLGDGLIADIVVMPEEVTAG
jgi:hypothetical protein